MESTKLTALLDDTILSGQETYHAYFKNRKKAGNDQEAFNEILQQISLLVSETIETVLHPAAKQLNVRE